MGHAHVHRPFMCRFNVHHHWQLGFTDDGGRYTWCSRCGKVRAGRLRIAPPQPPFMNI